jgi:hypothetical protein
MYTFSVMKDTETPDRAGVSGSFQIIEIKDFDDNDITNQFNQGSFYTEETLIKDIAKKFSLPDGAIEIMEI